MILSSSNKLFLLLSLTAFLTVKANPWRPCSINIPRIVGGQETLEPVPFLARISLNGAHHCGGAIINERTVLSAAHCFKDQMTEGNVFEVHVGDNTRTLKHGKILKAERIFVHKGYKVPGREDDAAIIRLNETLKFNERVQCIRISKPDAEFVDGSIATVYGWGHTKSGGVGSEILKYAEVPLMNHNLCERLMSDRFVITDKMICAGDIMGGTDSCQGDSGGPLVQNGRVIGIVSFGHGCADPYRAGVYTDARRILYWAKGILHRYYKERLYY